MTRQRRGRGRCLCRERASGGRGGGPSAAGSGQRTASHTTNATSAATLSTASTNSATTATRAAAGMARSSARADGRVTAAARAAAGRWATRPRRSRSSLRARCSRAALTGRRPTRWWAQRWRGERGAWLPRVASPGRLRNPITRVRGCRGVIQIAGGNLSEIRNGTARLSEAAAIRIASLCVARRRRSARPVRVDRSQAPATSSRCRSCRSEHVTPRR